MKDSYTLKKNFKYEILTPTGFQPFAGIRTLKKDVIYSISFSNGKTLKCSDNHPFTYEDTIILANELKIGTRLSGEFGDVTVTDITLSNNQMNLYDIVEVNNGNLFNVDGIVSHNCDFISSGYTVVDGQLLQWFEETHVQDPVEKRGFDGNYWIWQQPNYSKDYIVVADVARGDGADYSAFHVIDVETVEQVAEYRGKIETKHYGNMLVNVATEWNDAMLVIENANIGWAVIQEAIDRNYSNLYYSYKEFGYVDDDIHLQKAYDLKDKSQMVPGFSMTSRTRPLVISKLDTYMRERVPVIRSKRLIDELFTFIWNGSRAEAQQGYNDDLTISFATALWIRDTALKLRQQGIELNRKALSLTSKNSGVFKTTPQTAKNSWTLKTGRGDEDLRWLLD
jgi:hypothetical protein